MTKRTVTIELASGLEARPIAMLVQLASSYESTIYVQSDNKKINAKSIMGMMTLDLPVGEQVIVTAAFRGGGLFLINEKETEETDGIYTLARPYRVQSSGRIQ